MLERAAFSLLLFVSLSCSQSTQSSKEDIPLHQVPAATPLLAPRIGDLLGKQENNHLNTKRTYAHMDKDNAKAGLFIAAAIGTISLMMAVYCIYKKFYIKHQYLHTQLDEDPADPSTEPTDPPPLFFHGSVQHNTLDLRRAGYGSVSDSPSIISIPPTLSPPPSAMPFPPRFLSSHSLRTISAKDLEKSCI